MQPLPHRAGGDKGAGGGGKLSLTLASHKSVDQSGADSDADGKAWRLIFNRRCVCVWRGGRGGARGMCRGRGGMWQSKNVMERPGGSGPGIEPPSPLPFLPCVLQAGPERTGCIRPGVLSAVTGLGLQPAGYQVGMREEIGGA